jgi:spermidine synthase
MRGEAPLLISERDGVRSLHLGSERVQSAMRVSAPNRLELAYTRAMMGFLLFHPDPRYVLMIGLGGGSLAKFMHEYLPGVTTTVVELLPEVAAAARRDFCLPADGERLRVLLGEGGEYVAEHPGCCDVLLVDAFSDARQPLTLSSEAFYDAARDALDAPGVLVVNFLGRNGDFDRCMQRIEASFGGHVVCLPPEQPGNIIVFALKGLPERWRWELLRDRAAALETQFGLPFSVYVANLRRFNPHTARALEV